MSTVIPHSSHPLLVEAVHQHHRGKCPGQHPEWIDPDTFTSGVALAIGNPPRPIALLSPSEARALAHALHAEADLTELGDELPDVECLLADWRAQRERERVTEGESRHG